MKYLVGAAILGVGLSVSASAEPLYSVWRLAPTSEAGAVEYVPDEPFLVQRLLPYEAVRLTEPARIKKKKQLDEGVILFKVWQADGRSAYCTLKDQSTGHTSKSLFIPMLDKRPCLVDTDGDGKFDARFNVFDKYGSALTPSGNLGRTKSLYEEAAYETVDPAEFPVFRGFSFHLASANEPSEREITVRYDNGKGFVAWGVRSPDTTPAAPTALNVRVSEIAISDDKGSMNVEMDTTKVVVGTSSGTFVVTELPGFVTTER